MALKINQGPQSLGELASAEICTHVDHFKIMKKETNTHTSVIQYS